jgi:hypothetical protein
MGASYGYFNLTNFLLLNSLNVKQITELKSSSFLKHQIVICVHSFITKQHMIWAATIDAVNTSALEALGNITPLLSK